MISILDIFHSAAKPILRSTGFQFEVHPARSKGELGVWRKKWRDKKASKKLLVIPGFGDSSLSWIGAFAPIFPALSKVYDELLVFDYSGFHGFLSRRDIFPSFDALLDSSFKQIDAIAPDAVMGHSLGGWVAARHAVEKNAPEKLLLVSPGGLFVEREQDMLEWQELWSRIREEGFETYKARLFAKAPLGFRLVEADFTRFFSSPAVLEFMQSITEEHFLRGPLPKLESQVSLVWGDSDRITLSHWIEDWKKALASSDPVAVTLTNVGHSPHAEAPRALAKLLRALLTHPDSHRSLELSPSWKVVCR